MRRQTNSVQFFIRNVVRWGIFIPMWLYLAWPSFKVDVIQRLSMGVGVGDMMGQLAWGVGKTILIFWFANVIARIFHILPQWERLVLLRLGKSVGVRGPGFFIIPPFLYSIAQIIDIRITTYEVTATKTLTMDNVPVDVTAAVEMEVENPERAAIAVKDYWKTTEWSSMEALKSTIGSNDLRPLLSETEKIAKALKNEIDTDAKTYGVNVRAVRITDVAAPPTLVEELAVIARAERAAKAKKIQAHAEVKVAESLVQASKMLEAQSGTFELRQLQALLEMSKEESSMIIIYPMDSISGKQIANATAGAQSGMQQTLKRSVSIKT